MLPVLDVFQYNTKNSQDHDRANTSFAEYKDMIQRLRHVHPLSRLET